MQLSEHTQEVVREFLDAVIVKNQVAGAPERMAKPSFKVKNALAPKPKRAAHGNA